MDIKAFQAEYGIQDADLAEAGITWEDLLRMESE